WNGGIAQASPTVSTVEWWDCASIPNCLPLDNETLGFTVEAEEITALEVPHHCTTQIRYNCICRRSSSKKSKPNPYLPTPQRILTKITSNHLALKSCITI
ncbi:unnamed protein product, partial [Ilex paraguariensis]